MPLIDSLGTTDALAQIFSDASALQAMVDFEVSLARAEARAGVISSAAADAIQSAANADSLDGAAIARDARSSATVTIPFVKALTAQVRAADGASADFVHWGATSQDVADTATVLLLQRSHGVIAADHARLDRTLRDLSERHKATVMLGRTLLQPAPPITFGLKVAGWVAALGRAWMRLDAAFRDARVLQFGGATGTLAALGDRGMTVATFLAEELDLRLPDGPWHAHRDRLASVITNAGIYTATLGKIARDVSLLMQDDVAEAAEPGGSSSSMPHKRNPAGAAIALAAATRVPSLVAAFLTGMVQEHERAVGGWHAELPTLASAVQATGSAVAAIADVAAGLTVDPDRMRVNIDRTNGAIFAERAIVLLSPSSGKEAAQRLVSIALEHSRQSGRRFGECLAELPDASRLLTPEQLQSIDVPEDYLGSAEALRQRLLSKD